MCDPTLLAALTVGSKVASGLFSAGAQSRQGDRQGRIAIAQALQESQIGFDEAAYVGADLVDQFSDTSSAVVSQAERSTRAYELAASLARKNADLALGRSNFEENRVRDETKRQQATADTFFASANMDTTYGAPLMLAAFGAAQGETDALIVRAGGLQEAADQQWTAYGLADRASETVDAAAAGVAASGKAARKNIDSGFRTAGIKARGGNAAAFITATNARKAGQYGAATTLLSTATDIVSMGAGGKFAGLGIKGV